MSRYVSGAGLRSPSETIELPAFWRSWLLAFLAFLPCRPAAAGAGAAPPRPCARCSPRRAWRANRSTFPTCCPPAAPPAMREAAGKISAGCRAAAGRHADPRRRNASPGCFPTRHATRWSFRRTCWCTAPAACSPARRWCAAIQAALRLQRTSRRRNPGPAKTCTSRPPSGVRRRTRNWKCGASTSTPRLQQDRFLLVSAADPRALPFWSPAERRSAAPRESSAGDATGCAKRPDLESAFSAQPAPATAPCLAEGCPWWNPKNSPSLHVVSGSMQMFLRRPAPGKRRARMKPCA